MTNDRQLRDTAYQCAEPQNEEQLAIIPDLAETASAGADDRATCLATVYTYLLHRRARRLAKQADSGEKMTEKESDTVTQGGAGNAVQRAA